MATKPQPITLSVPQAGRTYFNLSRNASYAAASEGQIPTIRIGRLLRVPVKALETKIEQDALASMSKRGGGRRRTA